MNDEGNKSESSKALDNKRQIWIGDALLSAAELADVLEVSAQTISALTHSGVLQKTGGEVARGKNGKYHLRSNNTRYREYKLRSKIDPTEKGYNVARRQRMEETARLALLKRRQLEGDLVSIDLVVQFLEDLVIRVRSAIMAVPARVARKIIRKDPKSIVTIFSSELARALSELSQTKIADIEAFKKADCESGEEGTDAIERTEIEELA